MTQSGNSATGEYALNTEGRMRLNINGIIFISDPIQGLFWRVHVASGIALQSRLPTTTSGETEFRGESSWPDDLPRPQLNRPTVDPQQAAEDLGARTINGLACSGQLWQIRLPYGAFSNDSAIELQTELWTSDAFGIKVPILAIIRKGTEEVNLRELRNVRSSKFAADFFQPDPAYTIREQGG